MQLDRAYRENLFSCPVENYCIAMKMVFYNVQIGTSRHTTCPKFESLSLTFVKE